MPQKKQSHTLIITIGAFASVVMFAFCFLIAPFYSAICKAIGITREPDTSIQRALNIAVDKNRDVEIQFVSAKHQNLPWDFYPRVESLHVHTGEKVKITFFARNNTDRDMTVQAIPSMTPPESIAHFHKVECFCFAQQTLKAHESKEMALVFQLDHELPKDVRTISLAYTLFDVTKPERKK